MFGSVGSHDKTQFILERGMDAALLRRSVIADNISNVNTPHFKRANVTFESQLFRALKSENPHPFPAKLTHKRHIGFYQPLDYRKVQAKINVEHDTNFFNNKNNVDIEKEMISATKNTMRYNAMAQMISKNFKKIRMILS